MSRDTGTEKATRNCIITGQVNVWDALCSAWRLISTIPLQSAWQGANLLSAFDLDLGSSMTIHIAEGATSAEVPVVA